MKYIILISMFFCFKVHSFEQNFLLQRFAEQLEQSNLPKAFEWLRMWGAADPIHRKIASKLEHLISEPQAFQQAEKKLDQLLRLGNISIEDVALVKNLQKLSRSNQFLSCSLDHEDPPFRQPYDVSAKYLTSVTAFIAGLIIMPFSTPVGAFLVSTSGTILALDVIPTLVGNKMEYAKSHSKDGCVGLCNQITHQIQSKLKHINFLHLSLPVNIPYFL
jgi:hypothetical protein